MKLQQHQRTGRHSIHRSVNRAGSAVLLAAMAVLLLLSSCASLLTPGGDEAHPANARQLRDATLEAPHVEQLGHGPYARFVICAGRGCPTPTRKTLYVPPPAPKTASLVRPLVSEPTSTLEPASPAEVSAVVRFDEGRSALSPSAKTILTATVARAEGMPGSDRLKVDTLRVIGRTDSTGHQDVNDGLALARARVVRDYVLGKLHELPSKVELEAKGSCCYAASNETAGGRRINRRVELIFVRKGAAAGAASNSPLNLSANPVNPSVGLSNLSNSPPPDPPSDATPCGPDTADPIG